MKQIKFCPWLYIGFLFAFFSSTAQESTPTDFGIEFQAYPTGLIPGIRLEKAIGSHHGASLRLGYNLVRHGDAGEHMDERGGGFGFTLGYRRYFKAGFEGLFLGSRVDFWFNSVDWMDIGPADQEIRGNTKITVFQPTLELGYLILFGEDQWFFSPKLALGAEINIKTDGAEVGEGAILLGGVAVGRRF